MGKIKITETDIQEISENPRALFENAVPNEITRESYTKTLRAFLCDVLEDYLVGDKELREKQRQERLQSERKSEIGKYLDAGFDVRLKEFVEKTRNDPKWVKTY